MPKRGAQFAYDVAHKRLGDHLHLITATHRESGESVGHMRYGHDGTVQNITVSEPHQRKGVATAMWNHASLMGSKGEAPEPKHSVQRTSQGDAWAKAVGGHTPEVVRDMSEIQRGIDEKREASKPDVPKFDLGGFSI